MDDKIFDSLQRLEHNTGRLVAGQENLEKYIQAVSNNAKHTEERLENHVVDPEAHGRKAIKLNWQMVFGVIGALIGIAAFIYAIAK